MNSRFISPLRYPGGKGAIFPLLSQIMVENGLFGACYYEPFAGGAGCALRLLYSGVAERIVLNDADQRIIAFWEAVLNHNQRFIDSIQNIALDVGTWNTQREIWKNPQKYSRFEVGFATFYINRCSRSGILSKSGPIGGFAQRGKWKIDARFGRDELSSRVAYVGNSRSRIAIYNLDAVEFMKLHVVKCKCSKKFIYLDPPYVGQGSRLYYNSLDERGHKDLYSYISRLKKIKWLITYDNSAFIRDVYNKYSSFKVYLSYSLQQKTKAYEIAFAPEQTTMPAEFSVGGKLLMSQ